MCARAVASGWPRLPPSAGLPVQEKPQGAVPEAWLAALAGSGLATADVAGDLGLLLSAKDEEEAKNVKKAAYLVASALTKFAVPQLEGAGVGMGQEGALAWRWEGRGSGWRRRRPTHWTAASPAPAPPALQPSLTRRRRCGTASWRTALRR